MATKKKLLQAAAGNAGGAGLDVEEVFSTFLYAGNASTQTITNGIDLAGEGGLVWFKNRSSGSTNHSIFDTASGATGGTRLRPNLSNGLQAFNGSAVFTTSATGFALNNDASNDLNDSIYNYASWTFRKAKKFFTCLTYTGNGPSNTQTISHDLGSSVGMMIVKSTSAVDNWHIWHRGFGDNGYIMLNLTNAKSTYTGLWDNTAPTSTHFTVSDSCNTNNATYVAYLFAHNDGDGDFGPDGDADAIKCGSYSGNGSVQDIDLGFEAQWVLVKNITSSNSTSSRWAIYDVMRGMPPTTYGAVELNPNTPAAERTGFSSITPHANGFTVLNGVTMNNQSSNNYIYIAIRRGTAVPTSATDVFGISYAQNVNTVTFPVDFMLTKIYGGGNGYARDRLRGGTKYLLTEMTNAEISGTDIEFDDMTGTGLAGWGTSFIHYNWKRAPSYMDCVAFTGSGTAGRTVSHNLGVAPEMMIVKVRSIAEPWVVYHKGLNDGVTPQNYHIRLTSGVEAADSDIWNNTAPTSSVFTTGGNDKVNANNQTYIAYLFASLDGISKVGSVTHSGTTNVDCGFSSGARWILIKRTDASGDWYVWDSTRGIVSANSPYLLLNSTAAEVTNTDYIDPLSSGFTITDDFTDGDYIFYAVS